MPTRFKSIIGEITRKNQRSIKNRSKSHIAPEAFSSPPLDGIEDHHRPWASLPPDLLLDIIKRIEATEPAWPARRDLVACAAVCRSWRDVVGEVVQTPEQCGLLTFPISLKQPGPREHPIQCFIRRERSSSSYLLYLGLSPALSGEDSKLLMAAKKIRRPTCLDFVISLAKDNFSRGSSNYVGKLRSNFLGTKFTVFESQQPLDLSTKSTKRTPKRNHCKQVSSTLFGKNNPVATVSYELNVLRTRGPRRMHCTMNSIPITSISEGGTAPTPKTFTRKEEISVSVKSPAHALESVNGGMSKEPLMLKNKAPRWHEQLQCWCLNFKGRVTVASVKNFQLVAAVDGAHNVSVVEQEKVILQFGKIGKDIFTMDYLYPLSAFQAFAVCLSSFDTKPACE
ncbi:hypothetical protein V2J09_023785 [Rumex salicifolius]